MGHAGQGGVTVYRWKQQIGQVSVADKKSLELPEMKDDRSQKSDIIHWNLNIMSSGMYCRRIFSITEVPSQVMAYDNCVTTNT